MARKSAQDQLEALQKKRAQIDARIKAAQARESDKARKEDTRRKVILGALALTHWERNPASEFAKVMQGLADEYVTRPADRALFPSLPDVSTKAAKKTAAAEVTQ